MKKIKSSFKITALILAVLLILSASFFTAIYNSGIYITQFKNNSQTQMMGYGIITRNKKLIMVDGGTSADTENAVDFINRHGGKVDYWFVTHPHIDHASVICDVIENTDIKINKVYYTMNDVDWYNKYAAARSAEAERFYNAINNNRIKSKTHNVKLSEEFYIDNIKIEILGIKNPEITENAFNNSSMVFKMNFNNKSMLFLGDTGSESSEKLIKNCKSKLKSYAVQMSHHGQSGATKELYEIIDPKLCFWPTPDWLWDNNSGGGFNSGEWKTVETRNWMEELGVKQNIVEKDGNQTVHIW